jgi:glycosyltransferase involved in cell wall biosynthesis
MTTIHQFTPVMAMGDGVSGSLLLTRALLRSLGYSSDIYAYKMADELEPGVIPLNQFHSNSCDLLLVHHSMGHDLEDWLKSTTCQRILVYHNITPSLYFHPDSSEYQYSIKGRQQLAQWKGLFSGAISVSPYNRAELEDVGYTNPVVIPLLVDSTRFDGAVEPPDPSWRLRADESLIVSVGRLVENKRQHLLLEAFWHLKKMYHHRALRLVLVGGVTSPVYYHQLLARICELGLEQEVTFTGKCSDGQLRWLYNNSRLMWCASEHEGFCIPLVEANFFSLPVISFASSNIPDTLGESGMLLNEANPMAMACATATVFEDAKLEKKLVSAGTGNLLRYSVDSLLPLLRNYLEERGIRP